MEWKKEKDNIGEHKVKESSNGVKVRILKKPSSQYKKKMERRAKKDLKLKEEKEKMEARERLIKKKMRDLAIEELKKEGKI